MILFTHVYISVHEEAEVTIGTEITVLDLCVVEPLSISHDIHVIENGKDFHILSSSCNVLP